MPEQTGPASTSNPECTAEATAYDSEKRKTFEKTYKVNKSDVLNVENKFGRVHVNTWDRNEIQVKVEIISRASSEKNAQELLDKISIADKRSENTVFVRTEMESIKNHGGTRSFEINYTISMPDENALTVKNSFGDVYLAALKGKVDVNVKYGSLKSDRLSNASNSVSIAYGSGRCGYINGGQVHIAYSDLNMESTNGLKGSSKFSDFKIGSLAESLDLELKYGSLRVDNVSKNVRKINVASGFSPIYLNFDDNTTFDFDVNVQFGNFNVNKALVKYTTLEKSHTSAVYKGKFGSASSKASVSIVSKYGDVKFTR
ncbi:hypothetical protein H9Q13_13895 [Pontibacter sp. JH31]|uniref:Adhesin domain-containing protein n=1 Tax=Pontibacter aquaedesilientis TaxID=2766980 RepID=A0ABR7XJ43_9BACT|nr:hypothetical protein [Pontibacter aquaedesilientis]